LATFLPHFPEHIPPFEVKIYLPNERVLWNNGVPGVKGGFSHKLFGTG
jgi:hypothetical protein